jgi:hypothetical protein
VTWMLPRFLCPTWLSIPSSSRLTCSVVSSSSVPGPSYIGGRSSGRENCRCGGSGGRGGGFSVDSTGCGGGAGTGGGGSGPKEGIGALSFKVILSRPNVEYLSVTVGCLCRPADRRGPVCVPPCHVAAGPGHGAGAVGAGTPVGGREGVGRAAGDMETGESKIGWSGVGSLKVCTIDGGGPGGGA